MTRTTEQLKRDLHHAYQRQNRPGAGPGAAPGAAPGAGEAPSGSDDDDDDDDVIDAEFEEAQ